MKLPSHLINKSEWVLLGPLGPSLPEEFYRFPVMGVDGGATHAKRLDVWVGDSDSCAEKVSCPHRFLFPPEKSLSDLSLALSLFSSPGPLTLYLWGLHGGRLDHEVINMGEICAFLENRPGSSARVYASSGTEAYTAFGKGTWDIVRHGTFSLVALKPVTVTLEGNCEYQLASPTVLEPLRSLGLSNRGHGSVRLTSTGPVVLFFPEAP